MRLCFSRRRFLAGAGAVAAFGSSAASGAGRPAVKGKGETRFLAFTDIHYRFSPIHAQSREWLERILARAERENVDFVIQLGDFTAKPLEDRDYVNAYNDFKIKTYSAFGNHDDDYSPHEKVLEALRLDSGHYFFDHGGFRFIVADPNYILADGVYHHYSDGNHSRKKFPGATLNHMPPFELEWLQDTIAGSSFPCIVFSHQSFERARGGVVEQAAVRRIFDEANAKTPGKVRLVVNGHHHCDHFTILGGIPYLDLNSASYQWLGWNFEHKGYGESDMKRFPTMNHTFVYDRPVSAIITLDAGGRLRIEGEKGAFYAGVTPESVGGWLDQMGRPATPDIQSLDLRFTYS